MFFAEVVLKKPCFQCRGSVPCRVARVHISAVSTVSCQFRITLPSVSAVWVRTQKAKPIAVSSSHDPKLRASNTGSTVSISSLGPRQSWAVALSVPQADGVRRDLTAPSRPDTILAKCFAQNENPCSACQPPCRVSRIRVQRVGLRAVSAVSVFSVSASVPCQPCPCQPCRSSFRVMFSCCFVWSV